MKIGIISVGKEGIQGTKEQKLFSLFFQELTSWGYSIACQIWVATVEELGDAIEQIQRWCDIPIILASKECGEEVQKSLSRTLNLPLVPDEKNSKQNLSFYKETARSYPEKFTQKASTLKNSIVLFEQNHPTKVFEIDENRKKLLLFTTFDSDHLPSRDLKQMLELVGKVSGSHVSQKQKAITEELHFWGIPSENLHQFFQEERSSGRIKHYIQFQRDEEWVIRLTRTEQQNKKELPLEKRLKAKWPAGFVGKDSLSAEVHRLLSQNRLKITAAESLTSGSFMSYLCREPDTGNVFEGGIVTYSPRIKAEKLGVEEATIERFGVVSQECAARMAEKARQMFDADISVSLTGVAGPAALEGHPPGTVWIGLAQQNKETITRKYRFPYDRSKNRKLAVLAACNLVRTSLEGLENSTYWDAE